MTYFCGECCMNWWPYQCTDGCCPTCGGGTRRTYDPVSPDANELHQAALAKRIARERSEHAHRLFEEFYAAREAARAAATQSAEPEQYGEAA